MWETEERDFTRWLTENIDLLASELGIEIEDARAEEAVGDFSADIVARKTTTGETVVIENQYNRTDHDHLGKLLTYSSGKNAGFTMWLAEEFRPEHRSVLERLNEPGPKGARFFAIRPRVVSVEGSEERGFAFEVVVEPNEWERAVRREASDSVDGVRPPRRFTRPPVRRRGRGPAVAGLRTRTVRDTSRRGLTRRSSRVPGGVASAPASGRSPRARRRSRRECVRRHPASARATPTGTSGSSRAVR
ncbi:MAG: hypothetical protein A07HR67_02361 [uncultured archaeon A07HR67]|nr:MAG: hypothetical protein A07HR67_02361 [uncultured archaeon A07HR67]